ncbi:MAG: Beta-galactosidase [Pyrinomonadaceae bacterium]|nr:Beta-galactosidase [Pyrinomonadaceae bacterium]
MLDGKPFVIRSGEMHYPRVPREHWRERFRMAKAMGLNAITTYVFWNLHEKTQGKFDFSGNLDIAEYARIAQEEGLFLIVRPGPYICTEWDFGGFPGWLLREKDMKVRTRDPKFLSAAARYMKEVGKQLAPHQITNGGNIILVQVENEYGSFGGDHEYMNAVKRSIVDAGFTVPLFTSDGPGENFLQRGTLPDVAAVINMGTVDDPAAQWANFARFRQNVPRMVGEYWIGWFDHWGEKHHTATIESVTRGIDYFLKNNISFNIYMFHGGWSFGYMAGANYSDTVPYQPDTSDYDYDSPLDAGGRPTPKFYAIRELIKRYFPDEKIPEVVDRTKFIELPKTSLKDTASLEDAVRLVNPIASERPLPMESVGQNFGFILYRKRLDRVINGKVEFNEQRDYSHVFVNGKFVGKLDRRLNEQSITINAKTGDTLDVLVENMGRINYGERLMYDRKGITESVHFGSDELKGWQIYRLPFDDLSRLRFSTKQIERPVFFRGSFSLKSVGDTFLDMRKWGKGHVWVNGHHLGRFWNIGPQQSLYLPAGWLKKGRNTIVILDLENDGARTVTGGKDILYETK